VLTAHPDLAPPAAPAERDERAAGHADRLRALGAEVCELSLPGAESDTWAVFYAETAAAHRATFPSRRDEYGPLIRGQARPRDHVSRRAGRAGRRALASGARGRRRARRRPRRSRRRSGYDELPPSASTSSACGCPSRPTRGAFSYLGWPAIAIGPLQLAGRDAAVVIGAALALEREGGVR
jgi:hypothetical protein